MMGARTSEALRWGALIGGLGREEPWRFLSAMFVHFGLLHIGLNMWTLWAFGRGLEQRLGGGRFVVVLLVTGIVGFLLSELWYAFRQQPVLTAGASGGLFGLVGAVLGHMVANRDPAWKNMLVQVAIYTAIFAVAFPVNNAAHLGGAISGFGLGYAFQKERRPDRRRKLFAALGMLGVVASLGSIVLSHRSPVWKEARSLELSRGLD